MAKEIPNSYTIIMDDELFNSTNDDVTILLDPDETLIEYQLSDNRYHCSNCGQVLHETQTVCPICHKKLKYANFMTDKTLLEGFNDLQKIIQQNQKGKTLLNNDISEKEKMRVAAIIYFSVGLLIMAFYMFIIK